MIGTTISQYKILSKLGEGGMGEVYLAEDMELGRQVALKVLPHAMAEDPERLERFQREAKAIAALNHPNIVTIYHVEEVEGQRLLIMEFVEGESLDKILPPAGLPLAKVFSIAIPLADALAAAHEKGIVHRDLKPANIMVTPQGRVKVLDFGLAKVAAGLITPLSGDDATQTAGLTTEGTVMGTAPYMSPEQLHGQGIDHRTDIFSLGIVLYEMAAGARPFRGDSGIDLASSILKDIPVTLTEIRGDLPRHLARIIHTCLEKDPRRRYQSALDVRNELERLQDEVKSGAVSGSQPTFQSGPESGVASGPAQTMPSGAVPAAKGRGKGLWIGLAGLALVLVALGAWWLGRGSGEPVSPAASKDSAESTRTAAQPDPTPSVAVLPFADLSPDKDQEYFTDGMTEELLQALGAVEGLKVPSRTAIFALKDKNLSIEEVGERLGVSTVLEGSVRKSGDRLRIAAQLVQVSDGFELWSDTYDRTLEDVFTVQDEIASSIATALQVKLVTSAELGGTDNTEAYDFLLRGDEYLKGQGLEDQEFACQMYEQAVGLDPEYSLAYVGLTVCHLNLYQLGGANPEDLEAMNVASAKAVELTPSLDRAQRARATYLYIAGDRPGAERAFEEAIRLAPDKAANYYAYGNMKYQEGDLEGTAELWEKAVDLDPEDRSAAEMLPQLYRSLGQTEKMKDAYERVLTAEQRHLELNPDDLNARLFAAFAMLELGDRAGAFDMAKRILGSGTQDSLLLYNMGCFYSIAGDPDKALDALEKSVVAGMNQPDWWRQDSDLDNVRDDPRFAALLERMESGG